MRDFFSYTAQMNLELYAQAISGGYSSDQCRALADAYVFALRKVSLARGSGKPFIAHLVGTASLVMKSGCPDN
jgi:(p)ppGpp synthase/HD superfamily hydrolase